MIGRFRATVPGLAIHWEANAGVGNVAASCWSGHVVVVGSWVTEVGQHFQFGAGVAAFSQYRLFRSRLSRV